MVDDQTKSAASAAFAGFAFPSFQMLPLVLPRVQAGMIRPFVEQQREFYAFLLRRCEQDLALIDRLAAAKEADEAYQALVSFSQEASRDYVTEVGKVAELVPQAVAGAMKTIREGSEAVTGEMRRAA